MACACRRLWTLRQSLLNNLCMHLYRSSYPIFCLSMYFSGSIDAVLWKNKRHMIRKMLEKIKSLWILSSATPPNSLQALSLNEEIPPVCWIEMYHVSRESVWN